MENLHVLVPNGMKKQARERGINLSLVCRQAIARKLEYQAKKGFKDLAPAIGVSGDVIEL